jgi:hypothetical protein
MELDYTDNAASPIIDTEEAAGSRSATSAPHRMDRLEAHTRIAVEISGLSVSEGMRKTHGRDCRATGVVPCRAEDGSIQ